MRRALVCSFVAAVSLCLVSGARADEKKAAAPAKKAAAAPKYKTVAASEMKWTDMAEMKGAQSVVLWGDPKKSEYGQINKWPGGTDAGWHTHTHPIHGVVISGTLVIEPEGQPAKELMAGSYIEDPGKLKHKTSCKAGADCVFFIHQHAPFDFIPAEAKK